MQLLTSTLLINSLLQLRFELCQCRSQMAKKRSRQGGPSSSHRSERVESSSQNHRTHGSVKSHTNQHRWLTTFCILFVAIFLLIYRQNYYFSTTVRDVDSNRPYVYQRGRVKADLTYREILTVHFLLRQFLFLL